MDDLAGNVENLPDALLGTMLVAVPLRLPGKVGPWSPLRIESSWSGSKSVVGY
jgi:hypothetical protein